LDTPASLCGGFNQRLITLIDERKNEKILGKCTSTNEEFLQITKIQAQYFQPKMKPWGWKHKMKVNKPQRNMFKHQILNYVCIKT
jgi:hypothetical protein